MKGLILDDEIEVVVEVDSDADIVTSHFFPPLDDPKMVRAVNKLNEDQITYSKRGRPNDNSGLAGRRFYNAVCTRCANIFVRDKDGKPCELTNDTEGWKKRVPAHIKVAAAATFVSRRGEMNTGN